MIRMEMTPHYAGVKISGTPDEFMEIVDAIYELVIDELSNSLDYYVVSNRILGVCYDIRHASMGDRTIEIEEEPVPEHFHFTDGQECPEKTSLIIVSDNILYPELCFVMMALNVVIDYRMRKLSKERFLEHKDPLVMWDHTILLMRTFQSSFFDCMQEVLTPGTCTRLRNSIVRGSSAVQKMYGQFLDLKNLEFLDMTPEKRKANLSIIAKRFVEYEYDDDYRRIKSALDEGAQLHGASPHDLKFPWMDEYSQEIDW